MNDGMAMPFPMGKEGVCLQLVKGRGREAEEEGGGRCVMNAIRRVFYGLAGERSRLINWPDPSPARSLSLVVG